jgi:hypothetical protein
VDAHGSDHRIALSQRHDCAGERIDVIMVVHEKPLLNAENLSAQLMGSGQMGGRRGKANMKATRLHRCRKKKGECRCHSGLPVSTD